MNCKRQYVPSSTRHKTTPSHILSSDSELNEKSEDEVVFAQYANNIRCFNCVELGHYKGSTEFSKTSKSATHFSMTVGLEDGSDLDRIRWNMCNHGKMNN